MRAQPWAQTLRNREGDQVVGHRQEFELLLLDPLGSIGVAALRAGAVIAGMVDKVVLAAVDAAIDFAS